MKINKCNIRVSKTLNPLLDNVISEQTSHLLVKEFQTTYFNVPKSAWINDKCISIYNLDCYRWYLYLHWTGQSPGHCMNGVSTRHCTDTDTGVTNIYQGARHLTCIISAKLAYYRPIIALVL